MRNMLLTVTFFSSLAFGATGLAAQTQFPLTDSQDSSYSAPIIGVSLLPEGRSAFAVPRPGEFPSNFYDFASQIDYQTSPSDQ